MRALAVLLAVLASTLAEAGTKDWSRELRAKVGLIPVVSNERAMTSRLCPVRLPGGQELILTASHVVRHSGAYMPWYPSGMVQYHSAGDPWGEKVEQTTSTYRVLYADQRRDLAVVALSGKLQDNAWFPVAQSAPAEGSLVLIAGSDERLRVVLVEAKVDRHQGGKLFYDRSGRPGSSGSCVVNQAGEVVGINIAEMHDNAGNPVQGIAELLVGPLASIPEQFRLPADLREFFR